MPVITLNLKLIEIKIEKNYPSTYFFIEEILQT